MILRACLLFYIVIIPYSAWPVDIGLDLSKWYKVKYAKIKTNTFRQAENGLQVSVNNSSSALVYKFDKPVSIKEVNIEAELKGKINYGQKIPGSKQADDFPLRLGLILKGKNKLNFFQKAIAPNWLTELNEISSSTGGLDKVYSLIFYTEKPNFEKREHPLSSYFFEVIGGKFVNSKLTEKYSFSEEKEIIGLWLSSDGDDTHSSYDVIIEDITIN